MFFRSLITSFFLLLTALISAQSEKEKNYDVIVVGAGAAGLSSGFFLKQQGKKLLILEKTNRAGGIVENGKKGSFSYAKGAEYLGEPYGTLRKIIKKLKIEMVEIPNPMDGAFYEAEFYIGDHEIAELTIAKAGKENFLRIIKLLKKLNKRYPDTRDFRPDSKIAKLDKISAKRWLESNGIHPFIQKRYNVLSRGVFGANLQDISALSFIPEAAFDYEGGSSLSNLLKGSEGSSSWTTKTGVAGITNAISRFLQKNIQYNSEVVSIKKQDIGYRVIYEKANVKKEITAKSVIVATPAPITIKIANDVLTKEQKILLGSVKYSQYITVALFSSKPIFDRAFDLALLDGNYITDLYDATWVERYYGPSSAPVDEFIASVYMAPKSYKDKSLLKFSDTELLEIIKKELYSVSPDIPQLIQGYDIKRFWYAYPVMTKGSYSRLNKLYNSQSGLYFASAYMVYPTFEAAVESGRQAAKLANRWVEKN